MNNFLKIGISSCFFHANPTRPIFKNKTLLYFEESMAQMIIHYNAIPLILPRRFAKISSRNILSQVDGLLLQGGSDVSPISYSEEPMKSEWKGDLDRDQYEVELIQEAMDMNKPVFGICRGLQVINVALGGSLYQDIKTQIDGASVHRDWEIYEGLTHQILLEPGTHLASLYEGERRQKIISIHHQAIKDLGNDLIIEARSEGDNLIEAIRYEVNNNETYVCGVQWHPEFQKLEDTSLMSHEPMLNDFLKAVKERR